MARKRVVSPSFWTDEKIIQIPIQARLLFIGLLNHADDEGIFQESYLSIKVTVFPADNDITVGLLEDYVRTMVELKLLEKGKDPKGVSLLRFTNWHDHQKINHPTPSKHVFCELSDEDKDNSVRTTVGLPEDSLRTPSQFNIIQSNIIKDNISSKKNQDFTFERFYIDYPRKQGKDKAIKAFNRVPKKALQLLFDGLGKWIDYWTTDKVDKQYIPLPATWLNGKSWEDEDIPVANPDRDVKFKDPLDKEIYNRNKNLIGQSERTRKYMEDAKEKATDVVPNLLDDFKKRKKESNAQPISEVIGQYMAQAEPDTSTDG